MARSKSILTEAKQIERAVTLINLAYTVLEAGYGFATNSLALLSDALHNFGDVLGLALAWGAAVIARRPPSGRHSYGWRRATLLSPLANAVLLMVFSGALGWEAFRRFSAPPEIPATPVIVVASLGILVKEGADDMDVEPMGLLVPGGVMVTLLVCLTLIGERLRDRFA